MYSAPPFRLKERGIWGIIGASMAQWMVTVVMVFAVFGHYDVDTFIFAVFYLLIGLRFMFTHRVRMIIRMISNQARSRSQSSILLKKPIVLPDSSSALNFFLLALIALIAVLTVFYCFDDRLSAVFHDLPLSGSPEERVTSCACYRPLTPYPSQICIFSGFPSACHSLPGLKKIRFFSSSPWLNSSGRWDTPHTIRT